MLVLGSDDSTIAMDRQFDPRSGANNPLQGAGSSAAGGLNELSFLQQQRQAQEQLVAGAPPSAVGAPGGATTAVSDYYRTLAEEGVYKQQQAALATTGSRDEVNAIGNQGVSPAINPNMNPSMNPSMNPGMVPPFTSSSFGGLDAIMRNNHVQMPPTTGVPIPNTGFGGPPFLPPHDTSLGMGLQPPSLAATNELFARQQLLAEQEAAIAAQSAAYEQRLLLLAAQQQQKPASKKGSRPKKPKDMPKRPLSAYNIFFKEERARILDDIPAPLGYPGPEEQPEEERVGEAAERRGSGPRPPHGKIGFENLAKTIGKRWKSLEPDRLAHYKKLASEDMERYKRQMDEYHQAQAEKRRIEEEEEGKRKREETKNQQVQNEKEQMRELEAQRIRERQIELLVNRKRKFGSDAMDQQRGAGGGGVGAGVGPAGSQPLEANPSPSRSYLKRVKQGPGVSSVEAPAQSAQDLFLSQQQQQAAQQQVAQQQQQAAIGALGGHNAGGGSGVASAGPQGQHPNMLREELLFPHFASGRASTGRAPGLGGDTAPSPDPGVAFALARQQQQERRASSSGLPPSPGFMPPFGRGFDL